MNARSSHAKLPYGLLELDASGLVVRYAPAFEQNPGMESADILGHDFFTEVMPATEVQACQSRFRLFMAQGQATDKFSATFTSEQGPVKVQILLARILEKSERGTERFALVRIMPD
jgi:photoactive yellow protein